MNQYAYTAWGEALAALTSETVFSAFRWVGQLGYYFDQESDSYYVRARRYGPGIGRWLSQDPQYYPALTQLRANQSRSGIRSYYEYVGSGPVMRFDPDGAVWWSPWGFLKEARRRDGHGRWGQSAHHCWAACWVGVVYGLGNLAAGAMDVAEWWESQSDWRQDIKTQDYGARKGNEYSWCYWYGNAPHSPERYCDDVCETWP